MIFQWKFNEKTFTPPQGGGGCKLTARILGDFHMHCRVDRWPTNAGPTGLEVIEAIEAINAIKAIKAIEAIEAIEAIKATEAINATTAI